MSKRPGAVSMTYRPKMFLNIKVEDSGRPLMKDQIVLSRLDEKILSRLKIPGFGIAQIKSLCLLKKAEWRHLGLDYFATAEQEKISWNGTAS